MSFHTESELSEFSMYQIMSIKKWWQTHGQTIQAYKRLSFRRYADKKWETIDKDWRVLDFCGFQMTEKLMNEFQKN